MKHMKQQKLFGTIGKSDKWKLTMLDKNWSLKSREVCITPFLCLPLFAE